MNDCTRQIQQNSLINWLFLPFLRNVPKAAINPDAKFVFIYEPGLKQKQGQIGKAVKNAEESYR